MSPIENAQAVFDTIVQDIKRVNRRSLGILLKTLGLLLGVLLIAFIIVGNIRLYVAVTFENDALNTTTSLSTSLVTLLVIAQAARWAERRWYGFALLKRLFGLLTRMNTLQNQIDAAKKGNTYSLDTLYDTAQNTWEFYTKLAASVGLSVPAHQES